MRLDLLSAALRYARDARHLLESPDHRSVDQAAHLAGFAPECALKACLSEGRYDKALGHEFADDTTAWVLALDPLAARRVGSVPAALAGWRPDLRYGGTGTVALTVATAWVDAASAAVDGLVASAWLDGEIEDIPA